MPYLSTVDDEHRVTVRAGSRTIENWNSYDVTSSMLEAADGFSLSLGPVDPVGLGAHARALALGEEEFGETWDLLKPDAEVSILLDDVQIMNGFVDERTGSSSRNGDTMQISGRDKCGRLLDESMELIDFKALTMEGLALKIIAPWLQKVDFSNAKNRALLMGLGRGAKGGRVFRDPSIVRGTPRVYRKVEPGETRWGVLAYFMHENDLLAWGAADGHTLIIGEPNYHQEPSYRFFHARAGSSREHLGNCSSFSVRDSVADRYSQIFAMGASVGRPGAAYSQGAYDPVIAAQRVLVKHRGFAADGLGPLGIGRDFQHGKVLIVPDDAIKNDKQAETRAIREMAERDANAHEITLTVYDHAQRIAGARAPTLYACDTIATVESEVFGIRGSYLITSVRFRRSREECTTEIRLVPSGTLLRS